MRFSNFVAGTLVVGVATGAAYAAESQGTAKADGAARESATAAAPLSVGRLLGVATDAAGAPLEAMLVSVSGPTGAALAVCDADGRFEFRGLRPGTYLLRAHRSGYATSRRHVVHIRPGVPTHQSLSLRPIAAGTSAVLSAGFAPELVGLASTGRLEKVAAFEQPDETVLPGPEGSESEFGNSSPTPAQHAHTEKAWRLRRARRSVLKDGASAIQLARAGELPGPSGPVDEFAPEVSGSPSSGLRDGFPVSGQFHLLTRTTLDTPARLWSVNELPGQIAHVTIGAPVGEIGWGVRGAVTTGDGGSWVLAGSYKTDTFAARHSFELGMSYSKQSPVREGLAPTPTGASTGRFYENREAGSIRADATWVPSSGLSVEYGATVARYGYLEDGQLFSPRAQVIVEPIARTRVRAAVSRNMLAPGAEEFLPSTSGVWLPPERTFAPLSTATPLQVERVRHFEVAFERDVGSSSVLGVRRFYQDVGQQMITMFGARPGAAVSSADHYYLANASGVSAAGWGLSFSHELLGRVHGVVDYSVTRARWAPWTADGLSPQTAGVWRTGTERFHDVTTSVETEIPETATHVYVSCRVNTAYARAEAESLSSGLDARFALRVKQRLPFRPFGGSDWAVLVDVRNLFREQVPGASVYDELLVVSPSRQFMGGLVVHF